MFSLTDIPAEARALLRQSKKQLIEIELPQEELDTTIIIDGNNILQNSFKWDRYFTTGNMLEIGTAIASEIEFTLFNDGYLKDEGGTSVPIENIKFQGKELTVYLGIDAGNREYWWSIGKFTITTMPHKSGTIFISALDRMVWLDMYNTKDDVIFSGTEMTLHGIVQAVCQTLNINYAMPSTLPNYDLLVNIDQLTADNEGYTFRQLIMWIAALTGTCAVFDSQGELVFRWIEAADETITPNDRYSSDVYEPVCFTGLEVQNNNETAVYSGVDDSYYHYLIVNNSLIQGEDWTVKYNDSFHNLWNVLSETAVVYVPFAASTVPLIYLEPMDMIKYKDNDSTDHDTIISHITFTLNGAVSIESVGKSDTEAKIVTPGGTVQEQSSIKALKESIRNLENAGNAARDRLTDLMYHALGLHEITVQTDDGYLFYFTTAPVPDGSTSLSDLNGVLQPNDIIYFFSGSGLAWCRGSEWDVNAGKPSIDWTYGIAKDGTAVLGLINTEGMTVSKEDTIYKTNITPSTFSVMQGTSIVFAFNGQLESQINRLLVKSNINDPTLDNNAYIKIGSAMLVPADGGMNIVYVEE